MVLSCSPYIKDDDDDDDDDDVVHSVVFVSRVY